MPKRHRPGLSAASVLRHVEEVVLATSGVDAFEIVFAVAAARISGGGIRHSTAKLVRTVTAARTRDPGTPSKTAHPVSHALPLRRAIAEVARRHPLLELEQLTDVSDDLLARIDELLGQALPNEDTLHAVFESLVPRVAKSDKGQFFTPGHVVDFIMQMLAPSKRDIVVDPACGSGAFLSSARHAGARAYGCDVDIRAVRVARLLALAASADPASVERADGLRGTALPFSGRADIVATNPPFAGRADAKGFEVASIVRSPERDVLFLERALDLLRAGGRLAIVLPYNKASGAAFAGLRRWLITRARVLAIVGLPRETFLPHTSQRTFVLFAQKRVKAHARPNADERTMFVVSERAGKDTGGEPLFAGDRLDHDLDDVGEKLRPFLRAEVIA